MDPADLYGLPLDHFTRERNALAKQLREHGRRERAGEVAKLRKPSTAAWAVNQLVRTQRREVAALFRAGDSLQKAQAAVVARRGDPSSLRRAARSEREAVDRLVERAHGLLSSDGHELTQARLEQVSETLHAAALDGDARAQVRDGCLVRELRHIGIGTPSDLPAAPRAGSRGGPASTGAVSPPARSAAAPKRSAAAPKRSAAAPKRSAAAPKATKDAERSLSRALRELEAARERHERAVQELRDAQEALAAARLAAEKAGRELKAAERSADS